jgi:antitoxin (DNA-binding transcriptional repressor) of toxin-antitoxin stability system
MKRATIRELKHATSAVLRRVTAGETIEVCRRDEPVAILSPPARKTRISRPDFATRLREIYGTKILRTTASDLISESRGDT